MGKSVFHSAFQILLGAAAVVWGVQTPAETLRIGGTGVALGGITVLADAYSVRHPGTQIEILPSLGSGGGIKAVTARAIDLGLSSRALKDSEIAAGARAEKYATTSLVFVTSAGNDIDGVTTDQVTAIYSGQLTHWPNGTPVRVVLRPATESATQVLRGLSPEVDHAVDIALDRRGLINATTDQENAETLERLSGSFGLVAIGQIKSENRQLKILAFNGEDPSTAVTHDPKNAFLKPLYLVSTNGISPAALAFRDFIFSDEAGAILSAFGYRNVK